MSVQTRGKWCTTLRTAAKYCPLTPRRALAGGGLIAALVLTGCAGHTTSATNVTATSATLNATVQIGPNDHGGVFWWEYSRDNGAHWTQTSHVPWGDPNCSFNPGGTQSQPIPLSRDVSGLAPNSRYIFRLVGTVCNSGAVWLDSTGTVGGTNYSSFNTRGPTDQGNGAGARYTAVLCYPGIVTRAPIQNSFGYGLFIFNGDTSVTHQADCGGDGLELDAVNAPSTTSPNWNITPPQGATFNYVSAQAKALGASGWVPGVSAKATDGSGAHALPGLAATDGLWHTGDVSGTFNSAAMSLKCPTACASSDPRAYVSSRRYVLSVKDPIAPSISAVGNLFSAGTKAGKQTLLVDGVDYGAGIRQFYLKVNGTPTSQVTLPCDFTTIDGVTVARSMPPCPALVPEDIGNDVTLTADTSSAPFVAGANSVQACAQDYSDAAAAGYPGNTTCTPVKTVTVASDGVGPDLTFNSTYSPASPNDYSLHIHAVDKGQQPSGVKQISIVLNGLERLPAQVCPAAGCPQMRDIDWSPTFSHPLNGSDHLTVIATDAQGNVSSSDFDLPSQVVHARLYDAPPAQGGQIKAQEWAQLWTQDSRREDSDGAIARSTGPCPDGSNSRCAVLRSIKTPADGSAPKPQDYSEVFGSPPTDPNLSEAASLLIPGQPDFGSVVETGNAANVLQSWQHPPPGANGSYQLIRSSSPAYGVNPPRTWSYWADAATKLPFKVQIQSGNDAPTTTYYDYDATTSEAGNPPADTFSPNPPPRPPSCLASGMLGGYEFNPKGMVYGGDPAFNAMINTVAGPLIVSPQGAAADGYQPRIALTRDGLTLSSTPADQEALVWDVTVDRDQQLVTAGGDVIVETPDGQPAAMIQSSSGTVSTASVTPPPDAPSQSGDEVVLDPSQPDATLSVQPVASDGESIDGPCITQPDTTNAAAVHAAAQAEKAALSPASSTGSLTRQIVVWINPHPALSNVTVTVQGNNGNCAAIQKTVGSDGKVVFGGCPLNHSFTVSVPKTATSGSGVAYEVADRSRTFKLTNDQIVTFHYYPISGGGGGTGGGDYFDPPVDAIIDWPNDTGADDVLERPAQIDIPQGKDCVSHVKAPHRVQSNGTHHVASVMRYRCTYSAYLTQSLWTWDLLRHVYADNSWHERRHSFVDDQTNAVDTTLPSYIRDECRSISDANNWRVSVFWETIHDKPPGFPPSFPNPDVQVRYHRDNVIWCG